MDSAPTVKTLVCLQSTVDVTSTQCMVCSSCVSFFFKNTCASLHMRLETSGPGATLEACRDAAEFQEMRQLQSSQLTLILKPQLSPVGLTS